MRPLAAIALLAVSLLVVGCSSGSSSTPSSDASQPAESQAAPSAEESPAASAPAESPAAVSAEPSIDTSAFGPEFAQIQGDLQQRLAAATAKMATATTPEALAAVFSDYADAIRASAEATRAVDWPDPIQGDIDKVVAYQEEMAAIYDDFNGDPSAIDQDRLAAIGAEMPAVVQRIAAYFGVTVTP